MQETVFTIDENNAEECVLIAKSIVSENMSIKQVLSKYANKDIQTVSVNEKEFLLKQTFKFMKTLVKHQHSIVSHSEPSKPAQLSPKVSKTDFQVQTEDLEPPKSDHQSELTRLEMALKSLQDENNELAKEIARYKYYAEQYQSQKSKIEELSRQVCNLNNKIVDLEPYYMMKLHKRQMLIDQEVKDKMIQEIPAWQKAAVKIQTMWRGRRARKNYMKLVEQNLGNRKKIRMSSERALLGKFVNLLKMKKLSLEDCFRAADLDGDKIVSCEEFTKFLCKLKLGVEGLELARLIEILDQDLSGKLESQEFYETLAAYRVISDTSIIKGYNSQVLSKLQNIMKEKSLSPEDLFRSCDLDNSNTIETKELEKVLKGLGLFKREILIIDDIMEKNDSGFIEKSEFLRKIKAEESFFKLETEKSTLSMPKNVSSILSTIEASGISLSKAFDLIHFPESGKVQISYIAGAFSKLFPTVNKEDIMVLLNTIDSSKTGFIFYKDLIVFLQSYAGTADFTENQIRQHIISTLDSQSISIQELLFSKGYSQILDISSFISFAQSAFALSEEQSISLFNLLSNFTGRVTLDDLQQFTLHSSSSESALSPRSKSMKLVEKISKLISNTDLKIVNIFKFADTKNSGSCSASEFCSALKKLTTNIPESQIFELAKILPPTLTLRDLEILIPEKPKKGFDEFGMTEEEVFWIVTLKIAIEKIAVDPRVLFYNSDLNKDKKISMDEFKNALKRCIPGAYLTYTDICLIFKAFDKNNDGGIDEKEFLQRLSDCSQSMFYKNCISKIREQQGQYEHMKASVRPRIINEDFPIPPMPLMHLSKNKDYNQIFERFVNEIPKNIPTFEFLSIYKLRLSSLITAKDIKRIFKLPENEAERVFSYLDLHNKGITYTFILCTVLDSYRYSLMNFPIPHNNSSDPSSIKILEKIVFSLHETPVFTPLTPLNSVITWENFTNLPFEPGQIYTIKNSFPKPTYNYHLSSALLNLSIGFQLCPIEILHNVIQRQTYCAQASEYFERFSLHPSDLLTHSQFVDKIGRVLEISTVEADALFYKFNFYKDSCKMVTFFTFFDMVLSMYSQGNLADEFPKLPFKTEKQLKKDIFTFFLKIAQFVNKPFIKYGLNLTENYYVHELAEAFGECGATKAEIETYFMLLILNRNKKIRCYHLAAVLESYDEFNKKIILELDLTLLKGQFSRLRSGLLFLKAKEMPLEHTLVQSDLTQLLPMLDQSYLIQLFGFIDTYGRGFIYAYQLATLIDISLKQSTLHYFPLCANDHINDKVKSLLGSNSRHLDVYGKSAISFYRSNDINVEAEMDLRRFQVSFQFEFTDSEAQMVFRALDFFETGFIRVYHYVACVESFCRNTASLVKVMNDSPLQSLYMMVLNIPENISTVDYFNDLTWHSKTSKNSLIRYLTTKFSLTSTTIFEIFSEFTDSQKDELFMYQFLAVIDLYRNCIEKGKIIREPACLPFKHKSKDIQTDLIFTSFANKLDNTERGSCDYFWSKGIDPTEEISVQEFFVSLPDFNSQQCGQLFKDLDFKKNGLTYLYHLLAVLETFRDKIVDNYCKPVKSKKKVKKEDALPLVVSPLQDALNKVGRYLAGDNPKRRALTANEIFGMMDVNSDGTVSMNEFLDCISLLPLNLSQNQIYLLLKEADLNGDGFINYKEFTNFILDFVKKPELKVIQSTVVPKPEKREIKGLKTTAILKPDSLEDSIMNLKLYIDSNQGSHSAIELVFGKIDYMSSNTMTPDEFSLALSRLKVPFSNSQKKSLMQFADKNRNGLIPYKDFIDFLYSYNFTEIAEETLPVSSEIIDYILKPSDFFTKYTKTSTVLNSEIAALKRCHELLKINGKFIDNEFGPETGKNGAGCLYFNGKPPSASYPKPSALEWPNLMEVIKDCSFFKDRISSNDVVQGSLGNCWFIGALSVLATRDELLRGSIQDLKVEGQIEASTVGGVFSGVYPPIFHCLSKKGIFVMRFFKEFAWRWVIVDCRMPMIKHEGEYKYVFGHCSDSSEIWVPIIEKAYAKLHGCYQALNNGLIDDALVDLTGLAAERILIKGSEPELLWKSLLDYKYNKSLLGCSIESADTHTEVIIEGEPSGLLAKHAYGIVDLFEIKNPNAIKKRHRLLRIRNPWGQKEWNGKWSSGDEKLKSHLEVLKKYLDEIELDEKFDPMNPNDGTFLICFKDWRKLFSTLFSCVDFPDHWSGLRIKGEWDKSCSGGVPPTQSNKDLQLWSKNPQFQLKLQENCEIFLTLSQKDGRFTSEPFPYKKSLFFICFAIMKQQGTEDSLKRFDETNIVKLSKLRLHREVNLRTVLSAGSYIIVPATKKPNQFGEFWLSLYFSCNKESVSFTYGKIASIPIAEEEENLLIGQNSIQMMRNTLGQVLKF